MSELLCAAQAKVIPVRGLQLQTLTWGQPNFPPVVLLHGYLDHAHTFDALAAALVSDFHLVAWSARGHGESSWVSPDGYYHFVEYVADLHHWLTALGLEQVVLVGHSMGGMIASLYAGAWPERVSALVNMEGWMAQAVVPEDIPARVRVWSEQVVNPSGFRPLSNLAAAAERLRQGDPQMDQATALHLAATGTRAQAGLLHWRHDPRLRLRSPYPFQTEVAAAYWQQITCPTLLMWGADSPAHPCQANAYVERLGHFRTAHTQEIAAAGHNLHLHQPQAVAQAIRTFLAQVAPL
jgi:pimeloyl-ACP methyl ester carboxylesterase